MIELIVCPVCDSENQFKDLDYLRDQKKWYLADFREENEPVGFKICKVCGYITYDTISDERLASSYNLQRILVQPGNVLSCNRKNEYHKGFFEEPGKYIKKDMKIIDIGCAQGSMLNLLHTDYNVPKENLFGTEYANSFRHFANYEYGLNVTKEPIKQKYDIVSYYHVLEHIQHAGKEFEKIAELLADDGLFYCSVPLYLEEFEDSAGGAANDFEEIYHLNHINVFTKQSFQNFLNRYGWEIIKENFSYYTGTYLLKKTDAIKPIVKEDYLECIKILQAQKDAVDLLNDRKGDKAVEVYPKYPDAYILHSLNMVNMKSYDAQIALLEQGLKVMPGNVRLNNQLAKFYFQWDENDASKVKFYSNNIKKAEKLFLQLLIDKPGQEDAYYFLGLIELKFKKDYDKAVYYLKKFIEINPLKFHESMSLIAYAWNEKGKEEK